MTKIHSSIGASGAERWFNCPGSVRLCEQVPRGASSFYAAQGTVAHAVGEFYLKTGTQMDGFWFEQIVEQDGHNIVVDEEMIAVVDEYICTVYEDVAQYGLPVSHIKTEQGFKLESVDAEAYGTCDVYFLVPFNRIVVYDFKYGTGVAVEVEGNKQLLYYALGAFLALSDDDREELQHVELVIIQRNRSGSVTRTSHTICVPDLLVFQSELIKAIAETRKPDASLNPGKHCRFCHAKAICPAIRGEIANQAKMDFADIPTKANLPVVSEMAPEYISSVLKHAYLIKDWVSSIESYAHSIAEAGKTIPGFKLVDRRSNRKWEDEIAASTHFESMVFDRAKLYTIKLKSPAQMEKTLGKEHKDDIANFVVIPKAGKVLVPVEDSREARIPEVLEDFAGI